ncbi:MAG: YdeI/OmpD-associated family protein [Clostridia bacterium]|nr:YdeI/OmpD-associated family protein [Clostridia bacterium]
MDSNAAPLGTLPVGLAMALAENPQAMAAFSRLPLTEQDQMIHRAHLARSKDEMHALVAGLLR